MEMIDPRNPHGVRAGQVWERVVRNVSHELHVVRVQHGYADVRAERSSRINLRTGFDRLRLVYDPMTAPPRPDLHQPCEACGHTLLIHGAPKAPSHCRKKTCDCAQWTGDVRMIDPSREA